jgi:hypothetical protein
MNPNKIFMGILKQTGFPDFFHAVNLGTLEPWNLGQVDFLPSIVVEHLGSPGAPPSPKFLLPVSPS